MMMQRGENEADASRRFEGRLGLLWIAMTYGIAAMGVWSVYGNRAELWHGWALAGLVSLLAGFFLIFHLVYLRHLGDADAPSLRLVAVYGLVQAGIIWALLEFYSSDFMGLAIALTIQLMGVLPVRFWAVPIVALFVLIAVVIDLPGELLRGNTALILVVGFQLMIWVSAFGVLLILLHQRQRLAELVEELRRAQEELRRAATQAHELATLRERTRLAREMHDSLGHHLVTVNVKLEVVERLYARDPARGVAELRATRDLVRQAMVDLRHSLDDLRGPIPAARDLPVDLDRRLAALRDGARLVATGDIAPDVPELPPAVAATFWAMLEESLRNLERHAAAGSVEVSLSRRGEHLVLRVADDGTGLAPGALSRPGRHGVTGMRERIAELGGTLHIGPRMGGGTELEATLPLVPATIWSNGAAPLATRESGS